MTLQYSFQPDCYRPDLGSACVQSIDRVDFGPQIAVWIQSADGTAYVDDLMVTNLTAVRGIGNRPGIWNFLSGPFFPYGRRPMSLPIWAHARGRLYQTLVFQDGMEDWLGFHESVSSPELYYCRPLQPTEINVDAITCPTKFNSSKGVYYKGQTLSSSEPPPPAQSYYPPRRDLGASYTAIDRDCEIEGATIADGCVVDAEGYATLDTSKNGVGLDAVAAATPPYGSTYTGSWNVPQDLPSGDYAVMVEVNKEYDSNPSHMHPDFDDPRLLGYGIDGNFGQPSVVYKVPVHIDVASGTTMESAVSQIAGYGDWTGATGVVNPPDGTISTSDPGSGEARLLVINGPGGSGRVHVSLQRCQGCDPLPTPPDSVAGLAPATGGLGATTATFTFMNAQSNGGQVASYQIRYAAGTAMTDDQFSTAISVQQVTPGSPGSPAAFTIVGLKPASQYVVGVRALDGCGQVSTLAQTAFQTPSMKFTQLSGCFIATAAYGSAEEHQVAILRRVRDRLQPASVFAAAATDLYYRAGPAAAAVLARSDTARALVRGLIGPLGAVAEASLARP